MSEGRGRGGSREGWRRKSAALRRFRNPRAGIRSHGRRRREAEGGNWRSSARLRRRPPPCSPLASSASRRVAHLSSSFALLRFALAPGPLPRAPVLYGALRLPAPEVLELDKFLHLSFNCARPAPATARSERVANGQRRSIEGIARDRAPRALGAGKRTGRAAGKFPNPRGGTRVAPNDSSIRGSRTTRRGCRAISCRPREGGAPLSTLKSASWRIFSQAPMPCFCTASRSTAPPYRPSTPGTYLRSRLLLFLGLGLGAALAALAALAAGFFMVARGSARVDARGLAAFDPRAPDSPRRAPVACDPSTRATSDGRACTPPRRARNYSPALPLNPRAVTERTTRRRVNKRGVEDSVALRRIRAFWRVRFFTTKCSLQKCAPGENGGIGTATRALSAE